MKEYNVFDDPEFKADCERDQLNQIEATMRLPKPGSRDWDSMVDFMRADLDSGMKYTKIEMAARKILEEEGRDFDKEFASFCEEKTTYVMKVKCAWCGLDMGSKPCDEGQQDKISHGICESCKNKM